MILVSLAAALIARVVAPLLYVGVASGLSTDSSAASWWHTVVLPAIGLTLVAVPVGAGLAGMLVVEGNRGRILGPAGRRWDRTRVTALVSILAGAFVFFSGMVLGFVHVVENRIIFAMTSAFVIALSVSVGLFLFWTAERVDPTRKRVPQIAFLLGIVAAGISTATAAASLLGLMSADPIVGSTVSGASTATGTLSIGAWIIVYLGILAESRPGERTSAVSG